MTTSTDVVPLTDEKIEALKAAALAATPQNIDGAEKIETGADGEKYMECPHCGGEGTVGIEGDYCNYDGTAIGVQFYGIGNAHGAAEAYFRAASPANVLALIERIKCAERALLASKPAVPEGWKLVPVEPTEEMAKAYLNPSMASWKQRYRAMLAASPTAPAQPCGEDAANGAIGERVGYMMKHKTGMDIGFAWRYNDPAFSADWIRIPLYAAQPAQTQVALTDDPIALLIERHAEILEENGYAYFELAYTRHTEWMAWICSNSRDDDPNRKVIARGQGSTPQSACEAALAAAAQPASGGK